MGIITIERKVLEKNDEIAGANRELLHAHGLLTVNMVSSPGAGKTTILERTLERLAGRVPVGVIEGDVQTDLDAQRISLYRVPAVQIVTRGGCHLEAALVRDALRSLDLNQIRLLIIENVGNLVCPSNYDLGEDFKIVVASTTEGDDKPLKYPAMFRNASVLLVNKVDLLPYIDCNIDQLTSNALKTNPSIQVFRMSARTGEGMDTWCDWLVAQATQTRPGA